MTKKDESPEEGANPYWSDELLAVLAEALGDEDRARQTLEGIIQQAAVGSGRGSATPTDNETTNGLGVHESRDRATANPAASTHNNELNTHDE